MESMNLTVLITGIVTVIGALVTGIVTIIGAIHRTQEKVSNQVNEVTNQVTEVTEVQNEKLDTITILVDGRYSDVLDRVATLQEMVATLTGKPEDLTLATRARSDASAQNEQVVKSKIKETREKSGEHHQPKQLNTLKQPPDESPVVDTKLDT